MSEAGGTPDLGKCSTGLQPNVGALLAYLVGWISGLVLFLIEKENKFVRFHAMQSICLGVATFVLFLIPVIGLLVAPLLSLILWIYCMVSAYQGKWFKLPLIGDFAAKQVGGI